MTKILMILHCVSCVDNDDNNRLVICKKLVNLMGGDIWVTSVVGKGSSFYFTVEPQIPCTNQYNPKEGDLFTMNNKSALELDNDRNGIISNNYNKITNINSPCVMPDISTNNSNGSCSSPLTKRMRSLSILVVDDNLVNQKLVGRMLEKMGHKADTALNGIECIQMLRHKSYQLVLMDINMPEMVS
jgi:hypothetical protein